MNINNNNNSLTTWEKPTELNFKMFALINLSSLSQRGCFCSCYYTLPTSGTCRPHLGYPNAVIPHEMPCSVGHLDRQSLGWFFQKDLPFLRHCSWSLGIWIWRVSLPSGRKGAPWEHIPPTHAIGWSALCLPHLPGLLSVALGWPVLTPCGLLPWAVPWGMPACVCFLLASKPFI